MIIVVSGVPGTGKTTIARALAKKLKFRYLDVNKVIKKYHLSEGYDKLRKTHIIDIKKLNKALIKEIKDSDDLVIDSHLAHCLPKRYVDLCIITHCKLKTLEGRLKKRRYHKLKIRENLDSEIFDVCLSEAKEAGHKILEIDTSKGFGVAKKIKVLG